MLVLPAIDILEGKPVRLYQGDYDQKEVVGKDIHSLAEKFVSLGTKFLHIVDLDGAKDGKLVNGEAIIALANHLEIPVQVGGGIRDMEKISQYLDNGINRVILGTAALENKQFLEEALDKYGERIVVGVDIKNDHVYGHGWLKSSAVPYEVFISQLEEMGVKRIIVTDISRDGTLEGVNEVLLKKIQSLTKMSIIAAGGVKSMQDVRAVKKIGLEGAITGKAIYAGTLNLAEALSLQ
ncbi:1-(5-phosphoribosyl)-5-[(5-phosphoribosylamino)methylideneamino]imidazole-4-carboxamide isomerase [Vagococcus elongatus]|uniref:1-(5-phosphoribosyl)-5-[(5-phosphoribosylamino)methylideneamino] imidazole-4-carboxamide isomerase n=1 Tax=Vagococcus elongatus TaxID=180344 RepID=A0A430AME3_9ENTE|nr:1-(5-phosphoribosyl)-5-[(5-phosphoribosylamino)methylideneamino]imidazole-4-carboxamide isomerase [Vagococcus elongatus]RSU09074.1 1-(5-phosphoribosyl)-5-[(5-phosphoribosylamino)methylideneamino]imidazole-4-carboxamide isomerase [Vagococcus elongatus]